MKGAGPERGPLWLCKKTKNFVEISEINHIARAM